MEEMGEEGHTPGRESMIEWDNFNGGFSLTKLNHSAKVFQCSASAKWKEKTQSQEFSTAVDRKDTDRVQTTD